MEEQLSYKAINGIIETINKGLDNAPDYVVDLVDRYQDYYITSSGFGAFCSFIVIIVGIILYIIGAEEEDDRVVFGIVMIVIGFIGLVCFVPCIIQGIYVPEIALIESFSSHLK